MSGKNDYESCDGCVYEKCDRLTFMGICMECCRICENEEDKEAYADLYTLKSGG